MRKYWIALVAMLWAFLSVTAGEILDGFFYTVPEKVYVNQPFELHCKVSITSGSTIEDIQLSNFLNDPSLLEMNQLRVTEEKAENKGSQSITVVHLVGEARGKKAFQREITPILHCSLVERRGGGFFSQWRAYPRRKVMRPFSINILELPSAGRPADFQGAIGQFFLKGKLSKNVVSPGDIITLRLELKGKGWTGNSVMPSPVTNALFKTYPVKEIVHKPLQWVTEQVWIPNSTNSLQVGAVFFPYFNPKTEKYESCQAGPFSLSFSAPHPETNTVQEVKVIRTEKPPAVSSIETHLVSLNEQGRHLWPLFTFALFLLVAFFILFQLVGRRTILGIILAVVVAAIGAGVGLWMDQRDQANTQKVAKACEAHLAPSDSSSLLFKLKPGAEVIPLEKAGGWTRVESGGRRGWVRELESSVCQ